VRAAVLAALAAVVLAAAWRTALPVPCGRRQVLLAACEGPAVVGFAGAGPAPDEGLDQHRDAELSVLAVDPDRRGHGHGSRLLAAMVDTLRDAGFSRAVLWVGREEDALRAFVTAAGWAPDGAVRTMDLRGDGEVIVEQVRLHTDISTAPPG
jgi:GNAT superfamily N-acetyltransferase